MRIGIIGAGKVGFSIGKYLSVNQNELSGYFSRSIESAREAAEFTGSKCYDTVDGLLKDSEVLFITVPDDSISVIWDQLKALQVTDKIICHCSGVLSSKVFSGSAEQNCYGYSIHPLLAVSDKKNSYREFSKTLFTIEGSSEKLDEIKGIFEACGNQVITIDADDKIRYHAAAVMSSNLVLGLLETATEELIQCGFTRESALDALIPLMCNNVEHLKVQSLEASLTGPTERADVTTVEKHLDKLDGDNRQIYKLLSNKALSIAKRKNPDRDYIDLEEII